MDDERQERTNENDHSQDPQLSKVADDDGIDDLRPHLTFKSQGQCASKVNDHVEGLGRTGMARQITKCPDRSHDNNENPDQLQGTDHDLGKAVEDPLVRLNKIRKKHK